MTDYLIVGAGFFGAAFAHKALTAGKSVTVVDRRGHIGGNAYTEEKEGILVHKYGPHIFHTSNKTVWDYVRSLSEFNHFINCPVANYHGEIYNLPFNMNTFSKMWGISTPAQAKEIIDAQRQEISGEPRNLEEQAISLVGRDVYNKLIKGYTQKQWGKSCGELPASIIKRLPVRFTYDNNYFNDPYQGIPVKGYTALAEKMFSGANIILNTDYLSDRDYWNAQAKKVIYTGAIDEYYDFCFGALEYRSLRFETRSFDMPNFQGCAVMNYTDPDTTFTRVIEHKHFSFGTQPTTVVTWEYPQQWTQGAEPYYTVNDERNTALYKRYADMAAQQNKVLFGGRLGAYRYYDMDKVIESAWTLWEAEEK